jgi:hypothetical protein
VAVPANGHAPWAEAGNIQHDPQRPWWRLDRQSWWVVAAVAGILLLGGVGVALLARSSKSTRPASPPSRMTRVSASSPQTAPRYPGATCLSDLEEMDVDGVFTKNGELGPGGRKIMVRGTPAPKGLTLKGSPKGPASVSYQIGGQYAIFKAGVALNDLTETPGVSPRVAFQIWADDAEVPLWQKEITYGRREECEVPVSGVDRLKLVVRINGRRGVAVDPVWIDPRVYKNP